MGLKGGLMALSSLQLLLVEVPPEDNDGLIAQVETLAEYLLKTWPDDPEAAKAQGIRIRLLLQKDNYDGAESLITTMKPGADQASFKRLLGQLLWNRSLQLRKDDKDTEADAVVKKAAKFLQEGLDGVSGVVGAEAMQAAVVLTKIYLKMGMTSNKAIDNA